MNEGVNEQGLTSMNSAHCYRVSCGRTQEAIRGCRMALFILEVSKGFPEKETSGLGYKEE